MAPNRRVKSRYPAHIDAAKLPPNVGYDPRGRGRWYHRDRKAKVETRLGDGTLSVAEIWKRVDALSTPESGTFRGISKLFQASPAWKKLSKPTQKDYENCHSAIVDRKTKAGNKLGDYPLEAWDKPAVLRWMDDRGAESESRMTHEFRYLKRVFRWSVGRGHTKEDPTAGIKLEASKRGETGAYVTDEGLTIALIYAPLKIALIAYLGYLTGRRKTDLLQISRGQIEAEGLAFSESKTGKKTIVLWNEDLETVVNMLKQESPGSTMLVDYKESSFDTAWQRLRQKLRKAGFMTFKFQDLRAKHATDFEESGGDATKNLQHSSRALTQRHYLRMAQKVVPIKRSHGGSDGGNRGQ